MDMHYNMCHIITEHSIALPHVPIEHKTFEMCVAAATCSTSGRFAVIHMTDKQKTLEFYLTVLKKNTDVYHDIIESASDDIKKQIQQHFFNFYREHL